MFHIIDEGYLCDALVDLVESVGYKAIGVSNPAEYLKFLCSGSYRAPAAIIIDPSMYDMRGLEVINEVRNQYPDQKFIILSGNIHSAGRSAKDTLTVLPKPLSPEALIDQLNALAEQQGIELADA